MPSSAEYQDAAFRMKVHADDSRNTGNHDDIAHYTLALRWLRVGAALEARTLVRFAPFRSLVTHAAQWSATNAKDETYYAPDPLTAAERAMGVANG